jgi:phosphoglycolate phosphatase
MKYRLAIFDFDGTLADSFSWFLGVFGRLADEFGFRRLEDHGIEAFRGRSARQLIGHLDVPAWKLPRIARRMRQHMAREIGEITLFPGVDRLLYELDRRGVRLAIVTSNSLENVRRVLGPENAALIDHYACGASIFGKRPKIREVLRAARLAPAEAICIGDEIRDLEAARAEGIAFGAVSWGYTSPEGLRAHGPEAMFESLEEILSISPESAPDKAR